MCEFYRDGCGFLRILELSNKPQQAVKPASQPPTELGTVGGDVRVGIGMEFNYSLKALRVQYEREG